MPEGQDLTGSIGARRKRARRATSARAILPPIAAAAGTKLPPLIPLSSPARTKSLAIPRLVIDLPEGIEAAPVETFEDVTGELSRLIAHEPRPRRHTTQPPPLPRPTPNPTRDDQLIGDWRIGFELGRGGMGAVFAASHREFGKRAALKVSHTTIDGGSLGAKVFHREARIVQLIDHPAMPDIFATGTHEGRPYLVMERLRGETLTQLCERGVDREQALDLLLDLCDVLAAAHDAKVVHRDLKLDNIFVLETPLGTRLKLLDWGFAYLIGEDDPLRGMIAGTLSYVAPEQVLGAEITPASDIYSLGVVAYRLLLGQSPFPATSDVEMVCRHLKAPPPHPAMLWSDIPKPLCDALIGMLAKEPLCRPTLAEVRAAFVAARTPRRRRFTLTRGIAPLMRPTTKPSWARRVLGAVTGIAVAIAGAAAMIAS